MEAKILDMIPYIICEECDAWIEGDEIYAGHDCEVQ